MRARSELAGSRLRRITCALALLALLPLPFTADTAPLGNHPLNLLEQSHEWLKPDGHSPRPGLNYFIASQSQQAQPISPVVQVVAFFGTQPRPGSGTIIHPSGLILTNSHVIHNVSTACVNIEPAIKADRTVILLTEKEGEPPVPRYVAQVLLDFPSLDLALVRITERVLNDFNSFSELVSGIRQLQTGPLEGELNLPSWAPWDFNVLSNMDDPPPGKINQVTLWGYPVRPLGETTNPTLRLELQRRLKEINTEAGLFVVELGSEPGMSGGPATFFDKQTQQHLVLGVLCAIGSAGAAGVATKARLINAAADMLKQAEQLLGIRINRAPLARFDFTPQCPKGGPTEQCPKIGEPITFDASASFDPDGTIRSYHWEIRDGDKHIVQTAVKFHHTFASLNADVTLVVEDDRRLTNGTDKPKVVLQRPGLTCQARIEGQSNNTYTKIQDAIADASSGATITVLGTCQEVITITKERLTLRGKGQEHTIIFGNGRDPIITVSAADRVTVEKLTLRGGSQGVFIQRSLGFTLRESAVRENAREGVAIREGEATLVNNVIAQNEGAGVALEGTERLIASGHLEGNWIKGNEQGGVRLEKARPVTLMGNTLEGNSIVGLLARGSEVSVLNNKVAGTKRDPAGNFGHGIVIEDGSTITIAGSQIEGNEQDGLVVINATAKIQEAQGKSTVISENYNNGVQAQGSSKVTLINALVEGNLSSGVMVFDFAEASISGSLIRENGFRGVYAKGPKETQLVIEASTITRNGLDEIVVADFATATIKNSLISENKKASGVFIADFASAVIEGNTIKNNAECGIAASKKATVSGGNNEISGNKPDLCCPVPASLRKTPPATKAKVNVPEEARSVQEAVDVLLPGGMIIIAPGVYPEAVTITKDLTLKGAGADQTTIANTISILSEAGHVTIQGVTVTRGRDGIGLCGSAEARITAVRIIDNDETGINVPGAAHVTLDETRIEGNKRGVVVADEAQAIISNSIISDNRFRPSPGEALASTAVANSTSEQENDFGPDYFAGILAKKSGRVAVINSKIIDNEHGIVIVDSAQAVVEGSEITGSEYYGVQVRDDGKLEIREALISQNGRSGLGFGIRLDRTAGTVVANSRITENNGGGILIIGSDSLITITDNEISRNMGTGIHIRESSKVSIKNNIIKDNQGYGISADEKSTVSGCGNELSGNQKGDLHGNVPEDLRRRCE